MWMAFELLYCLNIKQASILTECFCKDKKTAQGSQIAVWSWCLVAYVILWSQFNPHLNDNAIKKLMS